MCRCDLIQDVYPDTAIADVFVNLPAAKISSVYSYALPQGMDASEGCRVVVPFGSRLVEAVVARIYSGSVDGLKSVTRVIGPWFDSELMVLARKVADYYLCSLSETLKLFIPGGSAVKSGVYKSIDKSSLIVELIDESFDSSLLANRPAQRRLYERLRMGAVALAALIKEGFSSATITALINAGAARKAPQRVYRDSYTDLKARNNAVELNDDQRRAYTAISKSIDGGCDSFLLFGVTGSGKTEVYIRAAASARDNARQSIVLVPEIALTAQLVERFKSVFGERVGVAHSRLSQQERTDIFEKMRIGAIDVLIGARSAVFAPCLSLGLIILDEEHEFSYKQEERPYYHARKVALWRAGLCRATVVLGSATPSVESYYAAQLGEHILLELKERATGALLPEIVIIDMCEQFARKNRSVFSEEIIALLSQAFSRGEQAILLLNRRGHSTFVSCRECGYVCSCPRCDVSLTYHEKGLNLRCHYCGYSESIPATCPQCSSAYIRYFGTGTQKVEEELKKLFPEIRVLRMDQDTTTGKRGHEKIIDEFRAGKYDCLIGTQMVAKGHDIVNVSAVGVISADTALNLPDFRAHERTFALLTQAAGRAGRGSIAGKVVIQSYNSNHYAVASVAEGDYKSYYAKEVEWRKELGYPPFCALIKIVVRDNDGEQANKRAACIAEQLKRDNCAVIGPAPALVAKINGIYREIIVVKDYGDDRAHRAIRALGLAAHKMIDIDVDPVNIV